MLNILRKKYQKKKAIKVYCSPNHKNYVYHSLCVFQIFRRHYHTNKSINHLAAQQKKREDKDNLRAYKIRLCEKTKMHSISIF